MEHVCGGSEKERKEGPDLRNEERKKIYGVTTEARNVGLISGFLLRLSATGGLLD